MNNLETPALIGFIMGHLLIIIGTLLNISYQGVLLDAKQKSGYRFTVNGKIALSLLIAGTFFIFFTNFYLPYPCQKGDLTNPTCFTFSDYVLNLSGYLILLPSFFLPIVSDISGYTSQHGSGSFLPSNALDRITYLFMFCGLALGILNTFHLPEVPVLIDFIANVIAFLATGFALLGETVEHHTVTDESGKGGSFKRFTPVGILVGAVAFIGFLLSSSTLIHTNKEQQDLQENIESANRMLKESVTPLIDEVNNTLTTKISRSIAEVDRSADSLAVRMQEVEKGLSKKVETIFNDPKSLIHKELWHAHQKVKQAGDHLMAIKPIIDTLPKFERNMYRQVSNQQQQLARLMEEVNDLQDDIPQKIKEGVQQSPTITAIDRRIQALQAEGLKRTDLKAALDPIQAENRNNIQRFAEALDKHYLIPKGRFKNGDTLLIDEYGTIQLIGRK